MKICFATIVSPNYLAYARVLRDSVAAHAPQAAFRVLVVNREHQQVRAAVEDAGLEATFAPELGLADADFEQLAYKFDLVELNTALKPTFLKQLFARGYEIVVYLDPDICLYAEPSPVLEALSVSEVALIPHALAPAMDGLRPSDVDFLRTGTFNLGFIGLREGRQSAALLDWWESRCLGNGFNDPSFGTFVDQKWMDLAPSYFESIGILKHPGCNVAYWNLHERKIEGGKGSYRVNGAPLVFFHFSGVSVSRPDVLSRHQNRHDLVPGTALSELVSDYCGRLVAAGHPRLEHLPYSFAALDDGTPITPLMRRAACIASLDRSQPFSVTSRLQQSLRRARISSAGTSGAKAITTLNFDPSDRRVIALNVLVRLLARLVGSERIAALLRYATFLGWGGNFAAVLLDQPPELRHLDPRAVRD